MSKLLIAEHPLQVLPSLAVAIGLNEALVLQQVHYWLSRSDRIVDGRIWFYKSVADWQKEFPFWSEKTIRTAIKSLKDRGLLLVEHKAVNVRDRTLWYSIDYDALDAIADLTLWANATGKSYQMDSVNSTTSIRQDLPDVYRTETTTEITAENVNAADAALVPGAKAPGTKAPPCPHQAIIDLYHEILPMCPPVREWNDLRQRLLQTRWRENPKRQNLDWWRKYFSYVAESAFLTGRTESRGRRPFLANLEWLIRPKNMPNIIEGEYHDEAQP